MNNNVIHIYKMLYVEVPINDYYNRPELYPFMPQAIFDALESAYLLGSATAILPLQDLISMTHKIILNNGPESN